MYKKRLLTVAVSMALATASYSAGSTVSLSEVRAEQADTAEQKTEAPKKKESKEKETKDTKDTKDMKDEAAPAKTESAKAEPKEEPKSEPEKAESSHKEEKPSSEESTKETSKPEASKPETSKPEASKPETNAPETSKPETNAPETSKPETSKPETNAPETSKPETNAPETSKPETNAPETSKPETNAPETSKPETNAPETSKPETNAPETSKPETNAPETSKPETNAPETSKPETNAPETSEPQTSAPETSTEPTTQPGTQEETHPSSETQTEAGSEGQTEAGSPGETQTETAGPQETESETAISTETETETANPGETQTESGDTETESEAESETETEEETDPEMDESESETSEYGSNEELLAHQNIVIPPKVELEFRFTQVDERYALVRNPEGTAVYEDKSSEAREVGVLEYYGLCYILDDVGDGWYYIESGNVRGFVRTEDIVTDGTADRIVKVKGRNELPTARLTVARTENSAFTYTHTTVQKVLAEKVYAVAAADLEIHEQRKDSSRVTGTLQKDGLCYVLADAEKDWIFVESGDVRGFVKSGSLVTGSVARSKVSERGEANLALADLKIEPKDNKACYYTLTSVKEASQEAKTREAMVNFALQFVGNPYVWGGTSLTNGCDCSGYVQSIYAYFGYSLPRVADAQSVYGMQIPISSAEPGDLIFYAKNGYVYHVSMYIGNGQVVHAAGRKVGIITSGISGNAVWATRIITG